MPETNIRVTRNIENILNVMESEAMSSESMISYIRNHTNSEYVLIHKYLTHSDLIASGKRNERQGLDHNLLNYLSVSTMNEMEANGDSFPTAHQTCISLPRDFPEELGFSSDRTNGTVQVDINQYANIYLVNDTLEYFSPNYTKRVFDTLGKQYDRWDFNSYNLNLQQGPFTSINLTWAAHGIGTAADVEFHKLRRSLFRNDRFVVLIENNGQDKNVFIMPFKNSTFFTVLGIRNDAWARIIEEQIRRLEHNITRETNLGGDTGTTNNVSSESREVKRTKQGAWRKQLAEEMMNYTAHEDEVICPLTGITVNFKDAGTLFRASHIKAYKDSNENEKYDINNGILMCANADALFDKHLITIGEDGEIQFSFLIANDQVLLNNLLLSRPLFRQILNPQRLHYLEEHRRIFNEKEEQRRSGNGNIGDSEEVITDYLDEE